MAEQSGFFDAYLVEDKYDREYFAEHFAKYFASFIGNGIFGGKSSELIVKQKETANMSVTVLSGQAWINGYWYENDEELSLAIDIADGVLHRIDAIVLRWSNADRAIRLAVKKGASAANPAVPSLERNADYFELKLAEVYVKAGASAIYQENITDTRLDTGVCGLVQGVVQQFDTTEFGIQINSFIENFEASSIVRMNNVIARLEQIAEDNDISSLLNAVRYLEDQSIEDEDYPGCYYRMRDGEKEWLNAPMDSGIEYRLAERYKGLPVYAKMFYAAKMPNTSAMFIETQVDAYNIVSLEGRLLDNENSSFHTIPYAAPNQSTPACIFASVEYGGEMLVYASRDLSNCEGFFTLKYVKP